MIFKFDKKKINLTFSRPSKFNFCCSSIDLVPKKQSGWRIITILSHPLNKSFHDLIDPSICLVKYHTFDDAVSLIARIFFRKNEHFQCISFVACLP